MRFICSEWVVRIGIIWRERIGVREEKRREG